MKFLSFLSANRAFQDGNESRPWNPNIKNSLEQGTWVRTNLEICDSQVRPSLSGEGGFLFTLRTEEIDESDWNYGKPQQSGNRSVHLTFEVQGKEIPLFTGLLGRRIRVLGYQPGLGLSLESLIHENQELRNQIEEIRFQFGQLGSTNRIQITP